MLFQHLHWMLDHLMTIGRWCFREGIRDRWIAYCSIHSTWWYSRSVTQTRRSGIEWWWPLDARIKVCSIRFPMGHKTQSYAPHNATERIYDNCSSLSESGTFFDDCEKKKNSLIFIDNKYRGKGFHRIVSWVFFMCGLVGALLSCLSVCGLNEKSTFVVYFWCTV